MCHQALTWHHFFAVLHVFRFSFEVLFEENFCYLSLGGMLSSIAYDEWPPLTTTSEGRQRFAGGRGRTLFPCQRVFWFSLVCFLLSVLTSQVNVMIHTEDLPPPSFFKWDSYVATVGSFASLLRNSHFPALHLTSGWDVKLIYLLVSWFYEMSGYSDQQTPFAPAIFKCQKDCTIASTAD